MSTVKLTADSGGGTVALAGPSTTTSNAAVTLTLPQNDGDAGQVLTTNGSGVLSWSAGSPILEQWYGPCDGSTITLQDGNHTITEVTGVQDCTTSYVTMVGSEIAYTPPSGTTIVIYEMMFNSYKEDKNSRLGVQAYIDSDPISDSIFGCGSNEHDENINHVKVGIMIGGTADADSGRLASWTSSKTLTMKVKEWSSSNEVRVHVSQFDGDGPGFVRPYLGITALKV